MIIVMISGGGDIGHFLGSHSKGGLATRLRRMTGRPAEVAAVA